MSDWKPASAARRSQPINWRSADAPLPPDMPPKVFMFPTVEAGPLKADEELASCISRFCPTWKLKCPFLSV